MTSTMDQTPDTFTDPSEEAPRTPVLRGLVRQLGPALRLVLVATVLLGVVYPAVVWGISRVPGLSGPAEGSVTAAGASTLIGIDPVPANAGADPWFHLRPSASAPESATAGLGPADPSTSGGSNLATTAEELAQAVAERRSVVAGREGVAPAAVPDDAVTASASGVDPDISPAYAALQVPRVARVTGLPEAQVRALVADATDGRVLGVLGQPTVNTSELNAALVAARPGLR